AEFALARCRRADDGDDRLRCLRLGVHWEGKTRRKIITSQMIATSASAPKSCLREKRIARADSIKFRDADSGVERLQNLIVRVARARKPVCSDLTHPDAVSPAATLEGEARDATRFVECAVND